MSPQPEENDHRSVLSWESVLDATDADTHTRSDSSTDADIGSISIPPIDMDPPASPVVPAPPAPAPGSDVNLTIAPLSLDPLSLDPLPPIPESPAPPAGGGSDSTGVIGDLHLELPPLELTDDVTTSLDAPAPVPMARPEPAAEPATEPARTEPDPAAPGLDDGATDVSPAFDMMDLKIAPLDVAQGPISGEIAAVLAADEPPSPAPASVAPARAPASTSTPAPVQAQADPSPAAAAPSQAAPASASAPAMSVAAPTSEPSPAPVATQAPQSVAQPAATQPAATEPAVMAGLPNDAVAADATPTTVIAEVIDGEIAPPAVRGHDAGAQPITDVSVVSVPNLQPNQINQAALAPTARAATAEPAPAVAKVSRKDRKHEQKLKKHQQKQALRAAKAKAKAHRSGGGGVALFFTLLILAGLIAGAIVYGKPYLFPDDWDEATRPYAEAVEAARGAEFDDPIVLQRRASDVYALSMTEHLIGPWEAEMPTWRSLGLVNGPLDAPVLGQLVADWTPAYYSPNTGEVIANDAAPAATVDAAITEAMSAAALDQEIGWSTSINDALLDQSALTRGAVTASSRAAADATAFGTADVSARDIGVTAFLPPVLEYRINAADAYAEFGPDNAMAFDAVAAASELGTSTEPQMAQGETLIAAQQPTDRTFWYLVFASFTDSSTAYAASNALVQASLATTDAAGTRCSYGTFSGGDVEGTARVADVLQQWVANVPSAMTASFTTLPNGSMQLRSCDPGVAFENGARFGVGREIARLRSVEVAAVTGLPSTAAMPIDPAAVIAEVRASGIGLAMADMDFATTPDQSAAQARIIVAAATLTSITGG